MMEVVLNGRRAIQLHSFLGTKNALGASDKATLAKLRRRLSRSVLETDEDGVHQALSPRTYEAVYTAGDVAAGVPEKLMGTPALGSDGNPIKMTDYGDSLSKPVSPLKFDQDEKGALFRLFLDRLRDKDTSGAVAEHLYQMAGQFEGMVSAVEATLRKADKPEPFKDEMPENDSGQSVPNE